MPAALGFASFRAGPRRWAREDDPEIPWSLTRKRFPLPSLRSSRALRRSSPIWAPVPESDWNSWQWQQRHRVTGLAELERVIRVTAEEREAIARTEADFH